jgi:hypothetical protein
MGGQPTNFLNINLSQIDTEVGGVGGIVIRVLAGATLLLGDVVYYSAADTVNKSATNANYAGFAGVVVGGQTYDPAGTVMDTSTEVGGTAATVGQWVLVQINGIAFIKSDGAILAGSLVIPDASVAGECDVAGANPGYTLGTALIAAADGAVGRMQIGLCYNEA